MARRFVPTKVHGVVDLVTGPALVAAPTLLRMQGARGSSLPPRLIGTAATAYSLLTDYEVGVRRVLPMRRHLALDAASGTALAAIPWVSGAARRGVRHWLPHALVGANEVFLALTTRMEPPQTSRLARLPKGALVALPVVAGAAGVAMWRKRRASEPTVTQTVATDPSLADELHGRAAEAPPSAVDVGMEQTAPPTDSWTQPA